MEDVNYLITGCLLYWDVIEVIAGKMAVKIPWNITWPCTLVAETVLLYMYTVVTVWGGNQFTITQWSIMYIATTL